MDWDTIAHYWEQIWKIITSPLSAGLAGSLLSLKWAPGNAWWERFTNTALSFSIVIYGCPWLFEFFHITSERSQAGISLAVGLYGLNLCAKGVEGLKQVELGPVFKAALDSLISFFPRKK